MSEQEVREAIAEQEEHIRRSTSCQGVVGASHKYRTHGRPKGAESIGSADMWSACIVCGVTETRADYAVKTRTEGM